jgi:hypothetical protein
MRRVRRYSLVRAFRRRGFRDFRILTSIHGFRWRARSAEGQIFGGESPLHLSAHSNTRTVMSDLRADAWWFLNLWERAQGTETFERRTMGPVRDPAPPP